MSDTLDREITAYEALLPEIRATHGSVWALVVHEKLVNTFKEFSLAARYAIANHGGEQVLIRHTDERMEMAPFVDVRRQVGVELWVSGPLIEITLHGSGLNATTKQLEGIIDTGASVICIDSRVAARLELVAINRKAMQVADGTTSIASIYMAEMVIPGLGFRDWVEVYALEMVRPSARVLLGRSFLKNYVVTYIGREDRFHFYANDDQRPHDYEEFDG